jgi:hypothetical protein
MVADKKEFSMGVGLMIGFIVVLVLIFSPIFGGINGLNYMDNLYNSISKNSAYYVSELKSKNGKLTGNVITVNFKVNDEKQATDTAMMLVKSGAMATSSGAEVKLSGDFGNIIMNCLDDSDMMFKNQGDAVKTKYGIDERQALFNWWTAIKKMTPNLNEQKKFNETRILGEINKKAVECAYNYYKVVPEKISDKWGLVVVSLAFYVIYTMWYGFAILFMFEGWGLKLEH